MTRRAVVGAVGLALAMAAAAGCDGGARTAPVAGGTVTVFAAASLTEAFGDLKAALAADPSNPAVTYSFAGSQQLVAQVEAGAPADVVATADAASMARLSGAGLVEPPRDFAANHLAIAVRPGNPDNLRGLVDLGRPGLRVVLADPSVPVGRYGAQALEKAGAAVRPVSLELDVKSVAAKVLAGEADAGIVYATDVPAAARVAVPEEANVTATYPVAVVRAAARAPANRAAAQAFVDLLLGPTGRAAMAGRGFLVP